VPRRGLLELYVRRRVALLRIVHALLVLLARSRRGGGGYMELGVSRATHRGLSSRRFVAGLRCGRRCVAAASVRWVLYRRVHKGIGACARRLPCRDAEVPHRGADAPQGCCRLIKP
jgi:hypothetical protein